MAEYFVRIHLYDSVHGNEYTGIWVIKALERRIVAATATASATATATDTQEESKQY